MTPLTLTAALTELDTASAQLQDAVRASDRWAVEKPAAKVEAITRVMAKANALKQKPHSATSAEAIVETDPDYARFLALGTANTLARIVAETRYRAAQYRCEAASRGLAA